MGIEFDFLEFATGAAENRIFPRLENGDADLEVLIAHLTQPPAEGEEPPVR
jgi:hypothetical protein